MDKENPADLGRFEVTKLESNKGMFKVPTVRDVKDTAPYMHDGRFASLDQVVEFYVNPPQGQTELPPLDLNEAEQQDLVAFMHALNSPASIRR